MATCPPGGCSGRGIGVAAEGDGAMMYVYEDWRGHQEYRRRHTDHKCPWMYWEQEERQLSYPDINREFRFGRSIRYLRRYRIVRPLGQHRYARLVTREPRIRRDELRYLEEYGADEWY